MEPYAYRENLERVLAFTENREAISIAEAAQFLGFRDLRTVRSRCPHFVGGWTTAATFAMDLCNYGTQKGRKRR